MKYSSKIYLVIVSAVTLLTSIFSTNTLNACGFSGYRYVGYSILHPGISESPTEKPFIFTYSYYKHRWAWKDENKVDKNIQEWKNYFCGKPKTEDLSFIIYKSKIEDLEKLRMLQVDANAVVPDTLKNSSFVKTFSQYKFPDFLDYLIFAKECEPHFTRYNYWKKEEPLTNAIPPLIEKGIQSYKSVNDNFLKLRYGYQILRLTRYGDGDMERAYNDFIKPLHKVKSVIHNRSIEQLGGWLTWSKNEKKSIHGNVLLAKSLIGNLERGKQVFLSFKIKDQVKWNQTIAACENNEQRSLIHYLRALDKNSIALGDMKSIYKLFPISKALEVLMTREMQKIELRYLNNKVNTFKKWEMESNSKYGIPKPYISTYISIVKPFVKKIVEEEKSNNPAYWMMMDGYLEYLTNAHRTAQEIFSKAKKRALINSILYNQIELLEFTNLLSLKNSMDEEMEIKFGKIIKNNKAFVEQYKGSPDFFMEKMASLYAQNGSIGKAYLCNYDVYGLKYFPNSKDAKAVLSLYDKPAKNEFEKYLLEDDYIKTREEIVDLLGTSYLGENQFDKAIETFQTIPNFGRKFKNPFQTYIFQHGMKKKYPDVREFSKLEIAQKIKELENEISQNPSSSAEAHLAMGNYYFNTSYFGYAWKVRDYFISSSAWNIRENGYYYERNTWVKGNKEFMDLSVARKHFKKIFELSSDKELEAKATLMLAQFEKINNFLKNARDKNGKKHKSNHYLTRLENDYFETKFYEEYLKECAPYNEY